MKPSIFLLIIVPHYVFGIVNVFIGIQPACESIIDCLSSSTPNTVCYQGYCVPCRNSTESCTSSSQCCSGSRCYRYQCTSLFKTGESCRFNRQCFDTDDFCINRKCTKCIPLWSPCSSDPLSTPCCIGSGICRFDICQPANTYSEACFSTFDCADELICLEGICQTPFGHC